jgi:hypothetical protein
LDFVNKKIKLFFMRLGNVGTNIAESESCANIPKKSGSKNILNKSKINIDPKEKME